MARTIWESTADITLDELVVRLTDIFGEAPNKSSISRRLKQEGWQKKRNKLSNKTQQKTQQEKQKPIKNNKVENGSLVAKNATKILTTEQKIDKTLESLVLDADAKRKIILKHRRRIKHLGELQEATMESVESLNGMDVERDEDKIKATLVLSNAISGTLDKLTSVQEMLFKQEMLVCGITPDDFQQSEQERRMHSLHLLQGISEQESQARSSKIPELMARLAEFERLEIDGIDAVAFDDEDL
ncbi:MAG: hypothetical protein Q4B81_00065 [Moraxella sp.]|nr:hypothetical protein [Moraxella sp.]